MRVSTRSRGRGVVVELRARAARSRGHRRRGAARGQAARATAADDRHDRRHRRGARSRCAARRRDGHDRRHHPARPPTTRVTSAQGRQARCVKLRADFGGFTSQEQDGEGRGRCDREARLCARDDSAAQRNDRGRRLAHATHERRHDGAGRRRHRR